MSKIEKEHENRLESLSSGNGEERSGYFPILLTLCCWGLIVVAAEFMYRPPHPVSSDAPQNVFSAERAEEHLRTLVADSIPHPAGSEQNKVVRDRVVEMFKSFGYAPELQTSSAKLKYRRTNDDPDVVPLTNIIARLPGNSNEKLGAVAITSHYDSVPYGPGASDDGVGTAALLEVARMLKSEGGNRRDIIFLVTDGEEYGLLGATQFVKEHELANEIEFVVNLEARGTTGPCLMFQTSDDSEFLINLLNETVDRPICSSVFYEVYKRMPHNTDFTVYVANDARGYNYAYIENVRAYHTPEDNFENADRGSLQHHGDNALALARKLSSLENVEFETKRAVYFDVMARGIVAWPESWSLWASCGCGILFFGMLFVVRPTVFAKDIVVIVLCIVTIMLLGVLVDFGLKMDGRLDFPWPEQPLPILLTYWIGMLAVYSYGSLFLSDRIESVWCIVWGAAIAICLLTSLLVAGASYLFLIPTMVAYVALIVSKPFTGRCWLTASIVAAVFAGLPYLPVEQLFYDAIGFKLNLVLSARTVLLGATLLPMLAGTKPRVRQTSAYLFLALFVVALIASVLLNPAEA